MMTLVKQNKFKINSLFCFILPNFVNFGHLYHITKLRINLDGKKSLLQLITPKLECSES